MIYLDNAATTKIDDRVFEIMKPYLTNEFGNPSSKYYVIANNASDAVKEARKNLAELLGSNPDELIFTSGATESNNFIIKGVADKYKEQGNHIITSSIEHKSVISTCNYLEKQGYEVTYIEPDTNGVISPEDVEKSIKDNTILISLFWGNNEIGSLNDIEKISEIVSNNSILFHTDATQVVGKIDIGLSSSNIDFLSMSGHKIHGPKGIGIAYIAEDEYGFKNKITPLLHGGEQEYNLRAGTLPVHNIVGIGKAAEIANKEKKDYITKIKELENYFKNELKNIKPNAIFNGDQNNKIPGIINITVPGINNEFFIKEIKDGIAISTGSACSITEPSHVLKAIGLNEREIMATLRISISKYNDKEDITKLLDEF